MTVHRIFEPDEQLMEFINECGHLKYTNNNSLKAMKFDFCLENGAWFVVEEDNHYVSVAGIHTFLDGYRALFRGAQIKQRISGLNKYHMTSYPFGEILPYQIQYVQEIDSNAPIYITTNVENDSSGKMNKIHRLFCMLSDHGIIEEYIKEAVIYHVNQTVWKLNVQRYYEVRYHH